MDSSTIKQPWPRKPKPTDTVIHLEQSSTTTTSQTPTKPLPKKSSSTIRHLFTFTRPAHIPLLTLSVTTAALVAAGRTAYAVLLGRIFEVVTRFGAGLLAPDAFLAEIARWAVCMCVLGVGMWIFSTVDVAAWVVGGELRARTAREEVFGVLLSRRGMGWFEGRVEGVGGLGAGVQSQTRELQTATSQTLGYLVCDIFVFLACVVVAFVYSFNLTLVMLATGVPSVLVLWGIARFVDPAIEGQKRELAQAAKHVASATTAIDLVKVYNGQDHEAFQFTSAIKRSAKYYSRQALCNCGQMSYIKLWMIMLFVLGFYFAVVLVDRGELTPGDALTTFYAVLIAFQSIETLGPQWLVLAKGMAAGQLLQGLVKGEIDQLDDQTTGWRKPSGCLGEIKMSNVTFAYPSNPNKPVITLPTLQFTPGQLTFIVGSSGSGKSTIGNLLVRFYEPLAGQITLDNNPIATLDLDWLRRNITLIQQASTLFNDTFVQNVAFGALDQDNVTTNAVQDACNMALLQSTIASMPDGINTTIGPGGYNLSGGQKQRLALARSKLRDPPVLILDEITSGMDPVSRSLIMEAIRIWRKGKTTIVITHEVGHIEEDEYVYVLADGFVVQKGFKKEISDDESGLFASFLSSADDASSCDYSLRGNESEYSSDVSDDEFIREAQYAKLLLGTLVDNRAMSVGLFRPISLRTDPASREAFRSRFISRRATVTQTTARKSAHKSLSHKRIDRPSSGVGRAPSIHLVTQQGLDVQKSRTPNARLALAQNLSPEHQFALDSLELFFLERLAKPKDREKLSMDRRLPSLPVILNTVWPTLDNIGKAQLVLGVILCLVIATSNPIFSFFFANLVAQFWVAEGQENSAAKWTGLLAIVAVVDASATFVGYFLMEKVAQRWVNTLRAEAIKRILSQPRSWFDKANHCSSRITQCLDRNAEEMRKLVGTFVPILLTVAAMIVASLIWALAIRWDLTLVTLSGLPVAITAARANALVSDKWEAICDEAATSTSAIFVDAFSNIKVVRALTLERYFSDRHTRSVSETFHLGVKRAGFVGLFYGIHQSILYFLTALVFFYAAKILSEGLTSVTDAIRVMNLLLFSLGTSIAMLSNVPQIAAAKATAVQMLYYANLSHAASHEAEGRKRLSSPLPVCMTNLRFAYPSNSQTQVLRNINLQLDADTCTAIVGASGCGKSTIASLLLRLYDPLPASDSTKPLSQASMKPLIPPILDSPTTPQTLTSQDDDDGDDDDDDNTNPLLPSPITYAHNPSRTLHTPSLRNHLAYVPQTPFLFPTTVRGNLTYGLHDTSPLHADSNIHLAAKQANIHSFIISLPQGYDTPLGEGGLAVSGGQAQRLCIARALARRPKLLVLDEPTSALDAEAAGEVRRVVKQLVGDGEGMAVVVVTHSKEMMKIADRVVMVEDGVVVESGGYEELAGMGGKFAGLVGGGVWTGAEGKGKGKWAGERRRRDGEVEKSIAREEALRCLEGGGHSTGE